MAKRIVSSGETLDDIRAFVEQTKELPGETEVRAKLKFDLDFRLGSTIDTIAVENKSND